MKKLWVWVALAVVLTAGAVIGVFYMVGKKALAAGPEVP